MSVNSNGTETLTQSMNGILSFNDGSGTVIENGTITTGSINLTNLNINEIQGITPTDNISLYTDSTGSVDIGSSTTAIVNVNANDNNILSANSLYMSSTNTTSVLASTINLISNEIIVGGNQDIYQANTSSQFTIGSNVTTRNFYLGNLTAPPQVPFAATQAYDVVNYDTCNALIASGGAGTVLYIDDIYMKTPSAFASLWSDNINGIQIGSNLITNTSAQSIGCNNGTMAIATIGNRTADTYISTGFSNLGNDYIHCGTSSGGNVYIACNNYPSTTGYSTTNVVIGGASTSTRYNGIVNICAYPLPSGLGSNDVNIGSSTTRTTIQSSALKLNSSNTVSNTVAIGSATTSSNTMLSTDIYVNSTNTASNNVYVGSATSATTDIKGQTLNINRTNFTAGNIINIGSTASTINLGETQATTINSYPIKPSLTTYNASTGTNISGSIGSVINGTVIPTTTLAFSGTGSARFDNIPMGNITLPFGVWMVSANVIVRCLTTSNLCSIEMLIAPNICYNAFVLNFSTGSITTANYEIPVSGCGFFVSTSGAQVASFSITVNATTGSWAVITNIGKTWFKAVRIA